MGCGSKVACLRWLRWSGRPALRDAWPLIEIKDNGCHEVEAVFVTMGLLHCDLAEAQRAFFNAPCRDAERRFHNRAMDLLEEAADHDA
ncbi:hypothetical protein QFZ32_006993 [Streptomyces canus]|nr:hypothetical protein [Streptomyces canus]